MMDRLTKRQINIYEGMKDIGGEALELFRSAIEYYYNDKLPLRAYHLAHVARELDGGLRDILSPKKERKTAEKSLLEMGIDKLFGDEFKTHKNHIISILDALAVDKKNNLANDWISVAKQFHKYAHRRGLAKKPRAFDEFKPIWELYEDVLLRLVGSYYNMIARIDRMSQLTSIDDASLNTILNLINNRLYSYYLFRHLDNKVWFVPLKNNNIFNPQTIEFNDKEDAMYWRVLPYLEKVSKTSDHSADLIGIIRDVVNYSSKTTINHPHIWHSLLVILNNTSCSTIKSHFPIDGKDGFRRLMQECIRLDAPSNMTIADIAEHILPKFVNDESMIKYVETIVDVITDIKAGGRKRTLSDRDEAEMKAEPYWLLKAFEKSGEKIARLSEEAILNVALKLKSTLEYNQRVNSVNIEKDDGVYEINVSRRPINGANENSIGFVDNEYIFELKQYSKEQLKEHKKNAGVMDLLGVDPDITIKDSSHFSAKTKTEYVEAIENLLPEDLDLITTEYFDKKMDHLYVGLFEDYSQIWLKSVSSGDRAHATDANEVLAIILRDLLVNRADSVDDKCREISDQFMTDQFRFPLFKRYVLFFINKYWDKYSDVFDIILKDIPRLLNEDAYEVELHDIFKNHHGDFTKEQNERIKQLIDDVPDYYREHGKKYINHWKFKWLSPLKESTYFKQAYYEAKRESEAKEDYEPERYPQQARILTGTPPITVDKLIELHKQGKLVNEFNKYPKEDFHRSFNGEPDREGLADTFEKAIIDNSKIFTDSLDQYNDAPPYYIHRMLWAFKKALREKKDLDWSDIITFCIGYFDSNKKLASDNTETDDDTKIKDEYSWAIGDAVDLIEDGSNENKLPKECFSKVKELFDLVSTLVTGDKNPKTEREIVNYALNTTMGKVVRSNIVFGLRVARETKTTAEKWGEQYYQRYFGKGIEAYIWFGHYLPQVRYLDKDYAEGKLEEFAAKGSDDNEWQAFMEGYLTSGAVYNDIYKLSSMRKHYEKAIDSSVFDKREEDRLAQHITIAYLRGLEDISESNSDGNVSLFWKLLHEAGTPEKRKRWLAVASFFWSISPRTHRKNERQDNEDGYPPDEIVKKILVFWGWTYDHRDEVKDLLGDEYNKFLGALADLTIYLPAINEDAEKWLLLSAPHSELHHMSSFFIEYLAFFEDEESIKRMGKIFLKILEGSTPTFRDDDIHRIVERMYALKDDCPELKDDADKICNTYGERGQHFLKELYFENQ